MLSFLKKKRGVPVFEIDFPKFSITPNTRHLESSLRDAGIDYTVVSDGYITFSVVFLTEIFRL